VCFRGLTTKSSDNPKSKFWHTVPHQFWTFWWFTSLPD